jgi:hypothetical protein
MRGKRVAWMGGMLLAAAMLPGCASWDGHFELFGYTTRPMYDLSIRTVYVPIFKNQTFNRGLEFQLTQAVIREIESKTPYKVVQCREAADTELLGNIVNKNKGVSNVNQLGETRSADVTLSVELVWRDLRTGAVGGVLSQPIPGKPGDPPPPALPVGAPAPPVLGQSMATYTPEIGESTASATKQLVDRLSVQIVSMMEKPW